MKKVYCTVFMVLLLTCISLAQVTVDNHYRGIPSFGFYDYNSSGFGARSRAMGGVFLAMSNNSFSSFLNPASMTSINKSLMSIEVINSNDEHQEKYLYKDRQAIDYPVEDSLIRLSAYFVAVGSFNMKNVNTTINQAGAVAPFSYTNMDWWFGGGYRKVYDFGIKFDSSFAPGYSKVLSISDGVDAINMSLAASPITNISLGINMNYYIRGYRSNAVYDILHQKDKSRFSGTNFDIGAIADFDIVRIGAIIRTGFVLNQHTVYFNGYIDEYGDDIGYINRINMKTKFPITYGAGIALLPVENLSIAADVDLKPYSKAIIDIDNEATLWTDINDLDPQWEDLTQFRFGAEYVLNAGFIQIPLRAGFHNQPSLHRNDSYLIDSLVIDENNPDFITETTSEGKQMNTNLFSFGSGLKFEKIWFDFAYEFGSSKYNQTVTTFWGYSVDNPIEYKYSRLYFSMGMLF